MERNSVMNEISQVFPRRWTAALDEVIAQCKAWKYQREVYDRIYTELVSCSDRDLQDIRICREDIPQIAAEAARKAKG